MDIWNHWFAIKIKFTTISDLCDMLYKELAKQSEELFSSMGFVPEMMSYKQAGQHSDVLVASEDFALLLRCCIVILKLVEFDQSVVFEKCQILITILKRLCCPDLMLYVSGHMAGNNKNIISFKRSVSQECTYDLDGGLTSILEESAASVSFIGHACSLVPFLCSILEVFTDGILVHQQLTNHLIRTDYVSPTKSKLFICHGSQNFIVPEMVSAHFLLSVSDGWAFNEFPHTLFWSHGRDFKIPELSLPAAMILLGTPIILTAPKLLQAHLVSLVSRCIGIYKDPRSRILNPALLKNCMSAFELSVSLYNGQMSTLCLGDHPIGANSLSGFWVMEPCTLENGSHINFESHVQPATYDRINQQIHKLVDSCSHDLFSGKKSNLVSSSIAYIQENQYVLDESYRDVISSALNCIVVGISRDIGVNALPKNGEIKQEVFLLAAVLQLMSCSLLQIIWFMRQSGSLGGSKTLKDYSLCREYDFITGIISCFGRYIANHPIQKLVLDAMEQYPPRHKDTKVMLTHFAGLLLFSFDRGPEFLWKGCIFVMMTLMNLFIFEEGNLDSLMPLLDCIKESSCSHSPLAKTPKVLVRRRQRSSIIIALQKIQTPCISGRQKYLNHDRRGVEPLVGNLVEKTQNGQPEASQNSMSVEDGVELDLSIEKDTCNGEVFINYHCQSRPSDYEDLADFVVCKRGKDYSSWLKKRESYRKWKCEKLAVVRLESKKLSRKKLIKGTTSS
ncbi:2-isopropylmalate synthase isoform X2 [Tasmannia lanceolata]